MLLFFYINKFYSNHFKKLIFGKDTKNKKIFEIYLNFFEKYLILINKKIIIKFHLFIIIINLDLLYVIQKFN